jgi:phosphoglycerol transferase MdoB-like AlkP superfamily enzyme
VQTYLKIEKAVPGSPIARQVFADSSEAQHKYNVVLVIMESMGAAKMRRHGNVKNITPFLDSIANHGFYFNNIYTAGIHTFNGIFSTLFSFPAIYRQHPMKESAIRKYHGIAQTLKKIGYSTTYFTTHDGQFDNVEGFLRANDFDNIISQSDYPSSEVKTTLGVPDDYMFRFSIPFIDKLAQQGKPFFVSFMTASDHGPWYVPDYFKSSQSGLKDRAIEYADWSLKQLVSLSSDRPWFDNTLFVFVADHGAPITVVYDISMDYHHTPLAFYAPKIIEFPVVSDVIGGQIDVFPTLMGFLNQPYINSTLGINLRKETRPYIIINDDDKLGVIGQENFLIYRADNNISLYHYRNAEKRNYCKEYPQITKEMTTYLKSNLQVFQDLSK